jgi:hypothetical protein
MSSETVLENSVRRTKIMFNYEHILSLRKVYAAFIVNKAFLGPPQTVKIE